MSTVFRTPRKVAVGAILGTLVTGCATGGRWEPSREEILRRILPSAVQVVVEQHEGRRVRTSSGAILASESKGQPPACFILTAGHTVSGIVGQKEVYVTFDRHRGNANKAQATVVAFRDTPDLDLALLKAEVNRCVPARAASPPTLGASVWVVGYPWGRHMTLASGIVSQINADDRPAELVNRNETVGS
jgi:S1-C subfamily serine protease